MILEEFFKYRQELLDLSKDDEGFIQESLLLSQVLPSMLDSKLIDSEDANGSYFKSRPNKLKINAYCVNESGERLQLFMINEASIDLSATNKDLQISQKLYYENEFKRGTNFINKAIKGHLNDEIQDSSPARALISKMSSSEGADQFDVVELFLITATATINSRTATPQPLRMEFENESMIVSYSKNREKTKKELLIKKRLIDLNFLHNVLISQGNREALEVDFKKMFGEPLSAIQAADEEHFASYLCVLPAKIIAGLYKEYSSRLLEKNVRSFLQFRGVNKGIRETIRKEPEKFVAYNNGLTITATKADIENQAGSTTINSLTDFQIVNGGQTTCTIYFTQKDGFDISNVKVMAKINVAKKTTEEELEELISNISNYSNAQSKVSKVDLRSRNPQLIKLKALSESVITPSGLKWFFERAKGEFNTMVRAKGQNKNQILKEFPTARRFSKELLAKYYCAWGEQPYLVKRGGEKVFRYFIEEISGEGSSKKPANVNRSFYEELIAKVILFRSLEKLYGQGKNSMGQLRSVAVPYSISILYKYMDGTKSSMPFDLLKIWLSEKLEDDLEAFFNELLMLMNDLVKKYSQSDDYGEYSKKPELWADIVESSEIREFMSSLNSIEIINKYGISRDELKKRNKAQSEIVEVDFHEINRNVLIHTNNQEYYKSIRSKMDEDIDEHDKRKITSIINRIASKKDIEVDLIDYENDLINRIRVKRPEIFDQLRTEYDTALNDTLDFIIRKYNSAVESAESTVSEFNKVEMIAISKKVKYASVFGQIGKKLDKGIAPNIQDLIYASEYFKARKPEQKKKEASQITLTDTLLRRMSEWEAQNRVLSNKERTYVADFAYGLKNRNDFHNQNLKRHLETLIKNGFDI
ncbi:AIPR family protein [Algoriphagus sp. SE2]|uniref:AIPR family protein n=1 Tax=Algoriphagus sp. SE2 TaxID=3141536 RepID=UPI0031CD7EE9